MRGDKEALGDGRRRGEGGGQSARTECYVYPGGAGREEREMA